MADLDATRTRLESSTAGRAPTHLLVVASSSSRRVPLPPSGQLVVGRGAEADLRVEDESVSRRHAAFSTSDGEVTLADLDSHNGTRVNGERLSGLRRLSSGDVVQLGDVALLVCSESREPVRELLDGERLRQRLEGELERAALYGRELGLLLLRGTWPDGAARAFDGELRPIDLVASIGPLLAFLLPECDRELLVDTAQRLLATLEKAGCSASAGVACFPDDGGDASALLAGARAALELAKDNGLVEAGAAVTLVRAGDLTTLVADPGTLRLLALTRRLAQSDLAVLVRGETGSGKEHVARALHELGPRAAAPFVALNSAAVQDTLVESELFGFEKGAFSGAATAKPGLLEAARGGTIFFDEVGELSKAMQAKLLRALDSKRIMRVGGLIEREIDVRIVTATNRDLEADVAAGRFRQDLLFRLDGATITLPPLRERPREIALLARTFLDEGRARLGRGAVRISPGAMRVFARYPWPGNVRELRNLTEYLAATLEDEALVEAWHLPARILGRGAEESEDAGGEAARGSLGGVSSTSNASNVSNVSNVMSNVGSHARSFRPVGDEMRELERRRMIEALEASGGSLKQAARLIGMPLRTFHLKAKQYAVSPRHSAKAGDE